tara:strand:- start:3927 stop:5189 length:1263 start_codon:yes stop_codon:yes gene_type:complete
MEAILLLVIVLSGMYSIRRGIVSPHNLFSLFFLMIYLGWFVFVQLINVFVVYKQSDETVLLVLLVSSLFYFVYFLTYFLLTRTPKIVVCKNRQLVSLLTMERCYKYFFLIGMFGLLLFILKNGFVLFKVSSAGYEQKNIANAGSGVARILYSVGFSYYIACRLIVKPHEIKSTFLISAALGILIFVAIGGGRASALLPLTTCVFYLLWNGRFSFIKYAIYAVSFISLIFMTTVIRYNVSSDKINDKLIASVIYKLQGSFSPADSVGVLLENYDKFIRYPEAALNNFIYFIPRALWVDKPIIIQNASGYFTKEILNYPVELTISVTLIGELLIYAGYIGVFIGAVFTAFYVRFLDVIYESSKNDNFFKAWYLISFISFFSLMREGLAVTMRDTITSIIITILVVLTFHSLSFLQGLIRRKT